MSKEMTMKVIAEGVRGDDLCPVVDEIARQAEEQFELAAEWRFSNDEDIQIFDLMMRLYGAGMNMEAVDLLQTVFALVGMEEATSLVGIIASAGRENVYKMFMDSFVEYSDRCEVRHITVDPGMLT